MTRAPRVACVLLSLAQSCLWESTLGALPPLDAGVSNPRADLERFAARLVGRYASPPGPRDMRIEQEFRSDGSYTAECVAAPTGDTERFCPYSGVTGDSHYELTGLESTGAVNAVTRDTIFGIDVDGEFDAMQLSADGETLTYVRVATLNSALVAILRDVLGDAGVYDDAFRNAGVARNFIELKRLH